MTSCAICTTIQRHPTGFSKPLLAAAEVSVRHRSWIRIAAWSSTGPVASATPLQVLNKECGPHVAMSRPS